VNETNAHRCIDAGARGVACIRSVLGASDPAAAAIRLWQAITLALLLCASSASADDARYQDYPIGTRAMALGGAFVALSDDPSGLYYNPAGICDTRRLNVSVSASLYGLERQSTTGKISIGPGTFSIAGLAELNVIPGEAGMIKGAGKLDERGASWAYGFRRQRAFLPLLPERTRAIRSRCTRGSRTGPSPWRPAPRRASTRS